MSAIDDLLPAYDVSEFHSLPLPLEPDEAIALALATPVAADPVLRTLFRLRGLRPSGSIGEALTRMGFEELARGEGEVVLGAAGSPWKPRGRIAPFSARSPGTVQMAVDFRADGARLSTETRVAAVDAEALRAFRRYWLIVGPFSALIRRRWLSAIARAAR